MPWEVTIINGTQSARKPLGPRENVIAAFAEALAGLVLKQPPIPSQEWLDQMPQIVRERIIRPKLAADFEGEGFSIQFYADDKPVIEAVGAEVRGNGNPVHALAALCEKTGWSVIDDSTNTFVDLRSGTDAVGWERFRNWRDKAIGEIRREE